LRERAQYDKAEALQREALEIRREELGAVHPDVAASEWCTSASLLHSRHGSPASRNTVTPAFGR
jgi:hypothetical protein